MKLTTRVHGDERRRVNLHIGSGDARTIDFHFLESGLPKSEIVHLLLTMCALRLERERERGSIPAQWNYSSAAPLELYCYFVLRDVGLLSELELAEAIQAANAGGRSNTRDRLDKIFSTAQNRWDAGKEKIVNQRDRWAALLEDLITYGHPGTMETLQRINAQGPEAARALCELLEPMTEGEIANFMALPPHEQDEALLIAGAHPVVVLT